MSPKTKYILKVTIISTVIGVWFLGVFAPIAGILIALWMWKKKNSKQNEEDEVPRSAQIEEKKTSPDTPNKVTEREQYCVAVWASATAAAYADGEMEDVVKIEAKNMLRPFLDSLAEGQRKTVAVMLLKFQKSYPQPSLDDAKREIGALNNPDYEIFDHVVQRIIRADSKISESEKKFLASWQQYIDSKRKEIQS